MSNLQTFDERAKFVKGNLVKAEGKVDEAKFDSGVTTAQIRENILLDLPAAVKQLNALRNGGKDANGHQRRAVDISLAEYAQDRWGFARGENNEIASFHEALGVNTANATLETLMTMPDFETGYRWLIVEVIRDAVRLGLRRNPLYPDLIAAEENVPQPSVILPHINMSDAMPTKIGEAETIPTGSVSFGQKTVGLQKVGTGLKLTDEVQRYVSLNVLSLYLEDVGVKLNLALDTLAITTLINGDGNGNAAPVIGVQNPLSGGTGGFSYFDLLRAWIRLGMLGRLPQSILSNENPALDILQLPEFKGYGTGIGPVSGNQIPAVPRTTLRTPVPTTQSYDIHGAMPSENQIMLIDATAALIKLNSAALSVESERIAERQISGTYVTLTTGFAKLFNDASLIIDETLAYSTYGFPTWMNPYAVMNQSFKD